MDRTICCKLSSSGKGESIIVDENARKRIFYLRSLVAGNGINITNTSDSLIISKDEIINDTIEGKIYHQNVNLILSNEAKLINVTFLEDVCISGYGEIVDCVFQKKPIINVHKITYTRNVVLPNNTSFNADKILFSDCTIKNIGAINCKELKIKNCLIMELLINITCDEINMSDSSIKTYELNLNSNIVYVKNYINPSFDCKLCNIKSNNMFLYDNIIKSQDTKLSGNIKIHGTIHSDKLYIKGVLEGKMDVNSIELDVYCDSIYINDSTWLSKIANINISKSVFYNSVISCNNTYINSDNFNINNSSINLTDSIFSINIKKLVSNCNILVINDGCNGSFGGDWYTLSDNLVTIKSKNNKIRLLPSFFECNKSPIISDEPITITALPSISNKQASGVTFKPPYNFTVQ